MAKVDLNGDGAADISISPMQIITIAGIFASIVGSYYTLNSKIDSLEAATKKLKENEQQYTWPTQRKLETDFQEIKLEMRDFMKDLEYLQKDK
jgi:hypothetical protein